MHPAVCPTTCVRYRDSPFSEYGARPQEYWTPLRPGNVALFLQFFFQSMTTRLEVHETSSFALLYFHITIITPGGLLITWRHVLPRSTHLRLLSWRYLSSRLKSSGGTTTHGYRSGATLCVLDTSLVGKNGVLTKLETPSLRWQVGVDCCFSLC